MYGAKSRISGKETGSSILSISVLSRVKEPKAVVRIVGRHLDSLFQIVETRKHHASLVGLLEPLEMEYEHLRRFGE